MELEQEQPQVTVEGILLSENSPGRRVLNTEFSYRPQDPMAVSMRLWGEVVVDGETIIESQTWGFGRDLLDAALSVPDTTHGVGDVMVHYLSDQSVVRLALIDARRQLHELYVDSPPLAFFVEQMYRLVPAGQEDLNLDAALREFQGGVQ